MIIRKNSSILCDLGSKYDTDKSSQRKDVTNQRHCHPYTLFYNSLFKNYRDASLNIAELGILDGASLLMWRDYFPNSTLYGFEYNMDFINNFQNKYKKNNTLLSYINVNDENNIQSEFKKMNAQYDIIIEDTTHQMDDQIRVIKNTYQYLKPGGIMIIEDIFKYYNEQEYLNRLKDVLPFFKDYYFVSLDHVNRNSTGWNNDKLFILVKHGPPLFTNDQKITIITPSCRPEKLQRVKESIPFSYVHEWIIVYDGEKVSGNPEQFKGNDKIKEYICKGGISGNPQRNYALDRVSNEHTYLYFLNDDNLLHPDLYKLLNIVDDSCIYTFNSLNYHSGKEVEVNKIDSAMFLVARSLCKDIRWDNDKYNADGHYIVECVKRNTDKLVFVDNVLSYYNKNR